jgi:hypothetical protein
MLLTLPISLPLTSVCQYSPCTLYLHSIYNTFLYIPALPLLPCLTASSENLCKLLPCNKIHKKKKKKLQIKFQVIALNKVQVKCCVLTTTTLLTKIDKTRNKILVQTYRNSGRNVFKVKNTWSLNSLNPEGPFRPFY